MISTLFNAPFFTGQTSSQEVPAKWDVSLNGRGYLVDLRGEGDESFSRRSIPLLRNQANTGEQFGEASLNPEELWRRNQDSWDHGAGQTYLDRQDADRRRFRSSKGVDVWTRWAMSLLNDTAVRRASANTNLALSVAGTYLYLTDGASLVHTQNLTTFTAVTGTPNAASSMTSDGFNVFTAHGASGVYSTTRGAGSSALYNALATTLLGYVKGRLMAANNASLYNITSSAVPAPTFTHPNSDFRWVGFAEGQTQIYAAGFSGDKSLIYRTSIRPDGTALDTPVVAGELPDGEIVRAIGSYLNFVVLGSDMGVRFCGTDGAGNLTIGALIRTGRAVRCFEGQDRFIWFGWTNYDTASTGLGRLDLSTFIASLTPAYASDLMADGQGDVTSVATFNGLRVFTAIGIGVVTETTEKVESGTLDTGLISYELTDPKVAVYTDVRLSSLSGVNRAYLSVDGGQFVLIGTRSGDSDNEPFMAGQASGEQFELRMELLRDSTTTSRGPVLTRIQLRAYPKPTRGEIFTVPLLLHEQVTDRQDNTVPLDVAAALEEIRTLQDSRLLVIYQVGLESHTVLVDDSQFAYSHRTSDGRAWNGTCLVRLKRLAG
jgi:hypothetical protein